MEEMFCFGCGLYHKKASMIKNVSRGGRKQYMCPACHEQIERNMNLPPAVRKARMNTMKKHYQKGGKDFEKFLKFCTRGD